MYRFELVTLRPHFNRAGYAVHLFFDHKGVTHAANPYGQPASFYGEDGRRVRAEALRFAKADVARRNRQEA